MENITVTKVEQIPDYPKDSSRIKVSPDKLDSLGKKLANRFSEFKQGRDRSIWETEKAEAFNAYHLVAPDKVLPYDGYPNLRCILPRVGVDTMHANTMYSVFNNGDTAVVAPDYISEGYIKTSDKIAKFLTYQLKYEANFYPVFDDADFNAHQYGNGYMEPYYCREYEWVTQEVEVDEEVDQVDPVTGQIVKVHKKSKKTEKVKKTIFDGIKIESIPSELIYRNPFIPDLKECVKKDVVFKLTRYFLKDIKRLAKKNGDEDPFYMPAQVEKLEGQKLGALLRNDKALEQAKGQYDGFSLQQVIEEEQVDILVAHLWDDIDGDDIPEKITVVLEADTGTILRVSFAPCRIVELKPRPVSGRAYGESIFRAGMPIYEEFEAIHNARVAKGQWENLPFGFYEAGGRFNPQAVQITPGHFYPLDRGSNVTFAQPPAVGMSYFQEEQLLFNYFERVLGIADIVQGMANKDNTATATIQSAQRSSIRMSLPITRITHAISELLGHMYDLNRDCAPKDKEFFVASLGDTAPIFDKITREDYQAQMSFKVNISTIFDQQMLRDTWLMAFRMFRMDPLINAHPAAVYELFKNTLKGMGIHMSLPIPPQAKALSPMEEHEMLLAGELVEPIPGEDVEEHLKTHLAYMQTDKYQESSVEFKQALMEHIDKTKILQQTLQSANLNQSGMFDPGMMQNQMPGMTASRNPSQMFNNMRIGETGNSAAANNMNDLKGNIGA